MPPEPPAGHEWLEQLVGEWASEMEGSGGPDQPPVIRRRGEHV